MSLCYLCQTYIELIHILLVIIFKLDYIIVVIFLQIFIALLFVKMYIHISVYVRYEYPQNIERKSTESLRLNDCTNQSFL